MNVFFTQQSLREYDEIVDYLERDWGRKVVDEFESKAIRAFDLLERFPYLGSNQQITLKIRGLRLTKQIRMLSTLRSNMIIVLSFKDVRANS